MNARQHAEAAFTAADETNRSAALAAHGRAMQAWLNAPLADRPHYWRALESAWRKVRQLGIATEAQHHAASIALTHGKLRSQAR